MRFTFFVFVLAVLPFSAIAQDKKDAAPQTSTFVLINGQPIQGKVLEIDGKHFVAVEDLAQSLRGTISYGDGQITLTLSQLPSMLTQPSAAQRPPAAVPPSPSSQLPAMTAQPPALQPPTSQIPPTTAQAFKTGRVKGTLTYFFDFHVGNKPDTGSKVWLVKGRVEIPADQSFVATSTAVGTGENPAEYDAVRYSISDENGNFDLPDVPPGEYTLILQSAHTQGALKEKTNLFGRGTGRNARDSSGRIEFLKVLIKAGETTDGSKDFGPNLDR